MATAAAVERHGGVLVLLAQGAAVARCLAPAERLRRQPLSPRKPLLLVALSRSAGLLRPRLHRPRRPGGGVRSAVFHCPQRRPGAGFGAVCPRPSAPILEHHTAERRASSREPNARALGGSGVWSGRPGGRPCRLVAAGRGVAVPAPEFKRRLRRVPV